MSKGFLKPTYADKPIGVSPEKLDDAALLAIGRLVRVCAELEDLVNLFICNLAEISESKMTVLLGRSAITKRIEVSEYLARMNGPEAQSLAEWVFNEGYRNTFRCRNDVAHGVLLGKNDDGAWSFLTAKTEAPEGNSAIQVVSSYTTDYLQAMADAAEAALPQIEDRLKLRALREARHGRPLAPHRKAVQKSQTKIKEG